MKKEERNEIKSRMLAGETVEEILQDAKFQGREEELRKVASNYQRLSLVAKGMPYTEIARQELLAKGIKNPDKQQIKGIYKAVAVIASVGKLVEPVRAKREEVKRRLAEGQSVQEIVADRTLNVCEEAVKAWQEKDKKAKPQKKERAKKAEKQVKKRTRPTKEEREHIITQILLGKSSEEMSQMEEELKGLSQEGIQQVCQEETWVIDAIRLVDYETITEDMGRSKDSVRNSARNKSSQGETIAQIRARKKEQLEERIQKEGKEKIETIAQELEIDLAVAQRIASQWQPTEEKGKKKIRRREDSLAVVEQMLKGKTPEEIGQMDEFRGFSFASIQALCQEKAWMKDALRLVPYTRIAQEISVRNAQVYKDGREYTIDGKSLTQIRMEKEAEVQLALQEENDVEKIATQFQVDLAVVLEYQQMQAKKTEQKSQQSIRASSQEVRDKVLDQLLDGKTPKEISEMEEFQHYTLESLEAFCQNKTWMILALQLVSYDQIAEQMGIKKNSVKAAGFSTTYQGKSINQMRKEKREKLKEGIEKREKSIETLAQELGIDLEVAREALRKAEQKQKKAERAGRGKRPVAEKKEESPEPQFQLKLESELELKPAPKPEPVVVSAPVPTPRPIPKPTPTPVQQSTQPTVSREERKQAVQKNSAYLRMRIMQGKYERKKQGEDKQKKEQTVAGAVQSEKERELIEKTLASMEARIAEAEQEISRLERKTIMQALYQEIKVLEQHTLVSAQAERFRKIMYSNAMDLYMHACGPEPHARMERMQRAADRKMIGAIEVEAELTNDLQKLQSFASQLYSLKGQNSFVKERLSSIINNKMTKIRSEQAVYRLYHEVPPEIEQIIAGVASGNLDVEKANETIEALAEQKVANHPAKGRFALTKEQQRRQIQMQIRGVLSKQAERFPIQAPEVTYRLLQQIGIQETMLNVKAIVENQVERKRFTEAKAFCNVYGRADNGSTKVDFYGIRNQIRNAEIGDLVLRGIQKQISPEGAAKFWETLETGIRMGNVKLSQVVLGKTADGTTDITLADIWPDHQKQQNR